MTDTLTLSNGRIMSYADYGTPGQDPVIWCHGGPGSRFEPRGVAAAASAAGFRLIGIDRPGYGLSTAVPGRTIDDWTPDALALAAHLGVADGFWVVGCSTGGSYAMALAAEDGAAGRGAVKGAIACCSISDMGAPGAKDDLLPATMAVWNAGSREAAMAVAAEQFGLDGGRMMTMADLVLPPADLAMLMDPAAQAGAAEANAASFAQGVAGYVDDRLADGPGWGSFDVKCITCPVTVLHGAVDSIVKLPLARLTASIVPDARLKVADDLGHFSIVGKVVETLVEMRG
jgi:pimeloyl-ACP methyl ester carboxylesterase